MKKAILLLSMMAFMAQLSAQAPINWTAPVAVTSGNFGNLHPRMAIGADGNPLLVWGHPGSRVYFARYNGTNFSTPVLVHPADMPVFAASWAGPDLAAHGDTVYIVFKQQPEDSHHAWLVHSYDGGQNFSQPVVIDNIADSISRFPAVTTNGDGQPLVAFMKFDPGFLNSRWVLARSNDFGNSFQPDILASGWSGGAICDCCPGSVLATGDTVLVLYRDNLNNIRDIWAGMSTDGGTTMEKGIPVDQGNWVINACPATGPDAVRIGDTLYTVYMSAAGGSSLVYWSKTALSEDDAATGIPLTGPIPGLASQNYPRIAQSGPALGIAWKQRVSGKDQIVLLFTPDVSAGLPAKFDTIATGNNIPNVDITLDNGTIHLAWQDDASGTVQFRTGTYAPVSAAYSPAEAMPAVDVFPNPFDVRLNIRIGQPGWQQADCRILSLSGQEMTRFALSAQPGDTALPIDLRQLPAGTYLLELLLDGSRMVQKIVKY